jgi:hypothetical protein
MIENSLGIEFCKTCAECDQPLREEEILSGLGKNKSKYTITCPICKGEFVPKITLYSENVSEYVNGKVGTTISMLPPVTLYKELLNIFESEGDKVVTTECLLKEHKIVFWNLIMYFKVMKLPSFILDNDFSNKHLSMQVSWI